MVLIMAWRAIPHAPIVSFDAVRARWHPSDAQLFDRHGEPLDEVRIDRRGRRLAWTALDDISPALIGTVIQCEDRRFWSDHGVDFIALARSLADRALGRGTRRGASTITMQLAALLYLSLRPARGHRSIGQKLGQIEVALAIGRRWSRRQVLEAYLNLVTYRGEIQGIGAAARVLFGKRPSGIDPAEAAVLAALIRAPNAPRAAVEKRAEAVRLAMHQAQPTHAELEAALARATAARGSDFKRVTLAPGLAEKWLKQDRSAMRCTIDRALQSFATQTLRAQVLQVRDRHVADGAVLVVENPTGEVWAYVAGTGDLSSAPYVDGVRAQR